MVNLSDILVRVRNSLEFTLKGWTLGIGRTYSKNSE
jgi:hypothetical protein